MDIFRREDFDDFIENVIDEIVGFWVSGTEHIVTHAPNAPYSIRASCATQFGIGGERTEHVAGEVDFGNDGDVAFGSIAHDVATFLLSVIASVGNTVILSGVVSDDGFGAFAAHLNEAGVLLDFHTPTLVVGEVPVETIDVVECNHVDEALHTVHTEEMACHVKQRTAIGETRGIVDGDKRNVDLFALGWDDFAAVAVVGQGFPQRLNAIESTCCAGSVDVDAVGSHGEVIGFEIVVFQVLTENDGVGLRCFVHNGRCETGTLCQEALQMAGICLFFSGFSAYDDGLRIEGKVAFLNCRSDFQRAGHNVEVGLCRGRTRGAEEHYRRQKGNEKSFLFHSTKKGME